MTEPTIFHAPYQLRRDYVRHDVSTPAGAAHDMFQRRMEPKNFNPEYFAELRSKLKDALEIDSCDNQLLFELSFVLLQNQASLPEVRDALTLLAAVNTATVHDLGDVRRLWELANDMAKRLDSDSTHGLVIEKVNWAVTNDCPMVCRGCYHAFVAGQLTFPQACLVADKLVAHGTRYLVLSGGDPLLWPHIFDLLEYLKESNIKVALDTTGYTLDRNILERVADKVKLLRLPLDGSDSQVQDFFRRVPGRDLFPRFLKSLKLCDEVGFDRVTVHTVVSQGNIKDLDKIAQTIADRRCVNEWVLFQWWPRRSPRNIISEMFIGRSEIETAVEELRCRYPDVPIYFAAADDRALINLFIQSDGQVATFGSGYCEDFILGNALEDTMDTLISRLAVDEMAMRRGVSGGLSEW